MVAFVGPAVTGVTGGNITNSMLSYGLSYGDKKTTFFIPHYDFTTNMYMIKGKINL